MGNANSTPPPSQSQSRVLDAKNIDPKSLLVNGVHKILPQRNLLRWNSNKPDWSDLPIDLLRLIANRLGLIDLLRFRVVCKTWNLASSDATAEMEAVPNNEPWFLLYDYDSKCMLKIDGSEKIYRSIKIPEMNGTTCIASNHGWLLLFKNGGSGSMFFFCPFSRAKIEIPKFPVKLISNQYIGLFSTPPTSDDCVICIVKIRRQDLDLFVLQRGNVSWTKHEIPFGLPARIKHAAFCRGVFYFLDDLFLVKFEVNNDRTVKRDKSRYRWVEKQKGNLPLRCASDSFISERLNKFNFPVRRFPMFICGTTVPYENDVVDMILLPYENIDDVPLSARSSSFPIQGVWLQPRFHQIEPNQIW